MRVHFWSERPLPEAAHDWNPDREPALYADGFGHNILELYRRLAVRGLDVTLGEDAPLDTRIVVFLPSLLNRSDQIRIVGRLMRGARADLVIIRSDFLVGYGFPIRPTVEVMPNQSSVVQANQIWVPPLPQRGLRPRRAERGDDLRTLGYKGYVQNLPKLMQSAEWAERLRSRSWTWDADLPDPGTGATSWHDFQQVDVALCLRGDGDRTGWLRKPATKLINAWHAGAIPLVGREPGYMELARHREDAMIVESADDVLATLDELRADSSLVKRLRAGGRARSAEFDPAAVLDRWQQVLFAPAAPTRTRTARSLAALGRISARWAISAARGDTEAPIWRPTESRPAARR